MTATDRVLTQHPGGKQRVRIERAKYDGMVAALLAVVPEGAPGLPFQGLAERVRPHLQADVCTADVSVSSRLTAVKLDLEARGPLQRLMGSPQRLVRTR
ncbi:MAG: hypothetical protein VYD05_06750 [Planctomycetota bacterium]|nr:hypothetical protein [Planctomycetota bacterium]